MQNNIIVNKLILISLLLSIVNCSDINKNKEKVMVDQTKLQITKMCSNRVDDIVYKVEIKDNILSFWKNQQKIKVYDSELDTDSKKWVNYEFSEKIGHPFPYLINNDEIGKTIFFEKNSFDKKNVVSLKIIDASDYMEGIEIYLIQDSKSKWIGHLVIWGYEETGSDEILKLSKPIQFDKCD